MISRLRRRLSQPASVRALTLVGVVAAGTVGVWLLCRPAVGPDEKFRELLGSFFSLLAASGILLFLGDRATLDVLSRLSGRFARFPRRVRWLARSVVLLASTVLLSLWFRDIAFSHDHAEHCFKAMHFWREMLGRGRLKGWTHFLGFGYPSGELSPFGPELWVALFRAATLGLLSWTQTYALAFSGVVVFAVVALYLFTSRFFGRSTGIIAVLVWVLDPGGWYQGGWFWLEWLGVWPVTLAMSFTLLSLLQLSDILSPNSNFPPRRAAVRGALWMLAALVTHQLPIVVYAVVLPCLMLAEALGRERFSRSAVLGFCATVALGFGLAAFYLVPMFARNGLTQDLGVRGFAIEDLAHRLVEMRVFENGWSPIVVLGLCGGVLAVRSRAPSALFFVLCGAVFVLLSSDILVSVFHVERLTQSVLKLECQRMLLVAKLFCFPLAAHAVVSLLRLSPDASASLRMSPLRRLGAMTLVAALGAPLLVPAALHVYRTQVAKEIEHRGDSSLVQDIRQFGDWARLQRQADDEPYRIAYSLNDQHDHIISIAPVFNDAFLYKVGYTSAQQFSRFPMSGDPDLLEALSVKFMVADHDLSDANFVPERVFGQLRVYRFLRYRPRHPFTLTGGGQVDLVQFSPEQIRLRLQGISPGDLVKLHVANFPRWEATLNGRGLAISPATVHGMEYPFLMEVPAGDGELVFRYVRRAPDWAGFMMTVLALSILGLLATDDVRAVKLRAWVSVTLSRSAKAASMIAWLVAGLALLFVGLAIWKMASPARLSPDQLFAIPAPGAELSLAGNQCEAIAPTRWRCGPNELRMDIVGGSYGSHICLTTPAAGPLVFSANTQIGRFLDATYDARPGASGSIRVLVDSKTVGETATRANDQGLQFVQADTRSRAGSNAQLRVELEGAPLHCFDLRIVR